MSLLEVSLGLGPSGSLISGAVASSPDVSSALVIAGVIRLAVLIGNRVGVRQNKLEIACTG
jgi:hypothetical protein